MCSLCACAGPTRSFVSSRHWPCKSCRELYSPASQRACRFRCVRRTYVDIAARSPIRRDHDEVCRLACLRAGLLIVQSFSEEPWTCLTCAYLIIIPTNEQLAIIAVLSQRVSDADFMILIHFTRRAPSTRLPNTRTVCIPYPSQIFATYMLRGTSRRFHIEAFLPPEPPLCNLMPRPSPPGLHPKLCTQHGPYDSCRPFFPDSR